MSFPKAPDFWDEQKEHSRKIALVVNGLLDGKSNNTKTATLTPDATETEVEMPRATQDSIPLLVPLTATAATAASVWTTSTSGTVTIYHDSQSDTDRTFGIVLFG